MLTCVLWVFLTHLLRHFILGSLLGELYQHTIPSPGRSVCFSSCSLSSADVLWVSYACERLLSFHTIKYAVATCCRCKATHTHTENFIGRLWKLLLATAYFALLLVSSISPRSNNATCRTLYSSCALHCSYASHFCHL